MVLLVISSEKLKIIKLVKWPMAGFARSSVTCSLSKWFKYILGPEITIVRGCENVASKLRQKW